MRDERSPVNVQREPTSIDDAVGRRATRRRWQLFGAGFTILVVALCVLAASGGVRGTDQYWYLGDVETLIRDGSATTNTIFPVGLLGPNATLAPPFIHNVLSVYLAALPALILGAYGGWLVLNVLATLGAALLIFLAARTVAARWAAVVCAVAYPILPVTFWHTAQPLAEASIAFFGALAMFVLAFAGHRPIRWLALVGAVGLLYLSRESYLPLLLAIPPAFLVLRTVEGSGTVRSGIAPTAALGAAVGGILAIERGLIGADNVTFSYARLLETAVPGRTDNMWFNFDLSSANLANELPIAYDVIPMKLAEHLADQFVSFDNLPIAVFFWTFNVLAIVSAVMLWRARRRPGQRRLVMAALAFVAVHIVTIALFQNQARYTVPALPGLLVVLAVALSGSARMTWIVAPRTLLFATLIALAGVVPAVWMASAIRSDAAAAGATERAVRALLDAHVGAEDRAIIVYRDRPQVLAYAAGPRLILYVSETYGPAEYERLQAAFKADWLLAPLRSPAIDGLAADRRRPAGEFVSSDVPWGLFRLPPNAVSASDHDIVGGPRLNGRGATMAGILTPSAVRSTRTRHLSDSRGRQ